MSRCVVRPEGANGSLVPPDDRRHEPVCPTGWRTSERAARAPLRGPRALLPTAPREPLDRGDAGRAVGRAVPRLERPHRGRVLPAQRLRPDRRRPRHGRGDREQLQPARLQRRPHAGGVAGTARTCDLRPDGCRGPRRRHRDRAGLPPLDPAARHTARHADRDPLGAGRLRAPLRAARRGDLAARVGGERRGARRAGRGGRGLHDPRAAAGRRAGGARHDRVVGAPRRQWPSHRPGLLRRSAQPRRRLRAGRHLGPCPGRPGRGRRARRRPRGRGDRR